ncbi:hypothetical protein BKA80DRAFT_306659 [Phyllosticta citrichinensis]
MSSNVSANPNPSMDSALAKIAELELQISELQSSLNSRINTLDAELKRLRLLDADLKKLGSQAVTMLRNEALVAEMMASITGGGTRLEAFTKEAEEMVEDLMEKLGGNEGSETAIKPAVALVEYLHTPGNHLKVKPQSANMLNKTPSKPTVETTVAKFADLKLQTTESHSTAESAVDKLEAKLKYLRRDGDLNKLDREAADKLCNEEDIKEIMEEYNGPSDFAEITKRIEQPSGEP